jgi:protein gp37
MTTAIQWTDETWTPDTGCDRISPGCDHCYALTLAKRLQAMGVAGYENDGDPRTSGPGFAVTLHPELLGRPLRWRKPRRVFVCSMADLFHKDVPSRFIGDVFVAMARADQHTFQVLTKRPQRMARELTCFPPLANVWLGTSVENQRYADLRIPHLLATPAAVRFLSCEPLLGPIDLGGTDSFLWGMPTPWDEPPVAWVIIGGESGPGARPMDLDWARSLIEQCRDADVAVFVKQLGSAWGRTHHDIDTWPEDLRVREWPS